MDEPSYPVTKLGWVTLLGVHCPNRKGHVDDRGDFEDCGERYVCACCGRECGPCFGCSDELFELCDDCAVTTWEVEAALAQGAPVDPAA